VHDAVAREGIADQHRHWLGVLWQPSSCHVQLTFSQQLEQIRRVKDMRFHNLVQQRFYVQTAKMANQSHQHTTTEKTPNMSSNLAFVLLVVIILIAEVCVCGAVAIVATFCVIVRAISFIRIATTNLSITASTLIAKLCSETHQVYKSQNETIIR
jgi:hypothetical protein